MRVFTIRELIWPLSHFHPPDTYKGYERFIAARASTAFNHAMASLECENNNAVLPRYAAAQDVASIASIYGPLTKGYGDSLFFWLDHCIANPPMHCYIWDVNVRPGGITRYQVIKSTSTSNIPFVICERGELTIMPYILSHHVSYLKFALNCNE